MEKPDYCPQEIWDYFSCKMCSYCTKENIPVCCKRILDNPKIKMRTDLKKIVLNSEQMSTLENFGVDTSSASAVWTTRRLNDGRFDRVLCLRSESCALDTPVFMLQDILDLLPKAIRECEGIECPLHIDRLNNVLSYGYFKNVLSHEPVHWFNVAIHDDNLIDAAYEMLCFCLEQKQMNR